MKDMIDALFSFCCFTLKDLCACRHFFVTSKYGLHSHRKLSSHVILIDAIDTYKHVPALEPVPCPSVTIPHMEADLCAELLAYIYP